MLGKEQELVKENLRGKIQESDLAQDVMNKSVDPARIPRVCHPILTTVCI